MAAEAQKILEYPPPTTVQPIALKRTLPFRHDPDKAHCPLGKPQHLSPASKGNHPPNPWEQRTPRTPAFGSYCSAKVSKVAHTH